MKIASLLEAKQDLEEVYFNLDIINHVESFMTKVRTSPNIKIRNDFSSVISYKFEGDYFGLLDYLEIEKKYHYIVLRFNGYTSSSDFKGLDTYVLVPDLNEIENIKNIFLTR